MTWAGDLSTVAPALPCPLPCLAAPGWLDLAPEAPGTAPRSVYEEGWWAGRRSCQQSLLGGRGRPWARGLVSGLVPSVSPETCPCLASRYSSASPLCLVTGVMISHAC